jgi:hypothetical protein
LNVKEKDGAEKYLKAMWGIAVAVTAAAPLVCMELVYLEIHIWGKFKTPYGIGAMGLAVSLTFVIFVDWLNVLNFVQAALIYVNSTLRLLNLLHWNEAADITSGKKDELIIAYRMHQTIHIIVTQSSSALTAIALASVSVLLITTLVFIIAFPSKIGMMITAMFVGVFIIATMATKMLLELATYLTECSAGFSSSFLRNDLTLTPTQRRALKASPPLQFMIGPFSAISRETLPFLMSDVVVARTVEVLVGMN